MDVGKIGDPLCNLWDEGAVPYTPCRNRIIFLGRPFLIYFFMSLKHSQDTFGKVVVVVPVDDFFEDPLFSLLFLFVYSVQ